VLEAEFQKQVVALAKQLGWLVMHTRPALNRSGKWSTPIQGHRGFPDLVLSHANRGTVFAELKGEKGRVAPEQQVWLDTLAAGGCEVHIWRPADLQKIADRLSQMLD